MPEINLKKNILVSGSFRIIVMILMFFVSWIIVRYLGVELKGEYSYVITIGGFIWIVLDLGLYHSYPYLACKFPTKTPSLYVWTLICLVAELVILLSLGLIFLPFWNKLLGYQFSAVYLVLFIGYITVTKAFMQLQNLYVGRNRVFHSSLATLLNTLICLSLIVLVFLFFQSANKLDLVLGSTLVALMGAVLYLIWKNKGQASAQPLDLKFVKYSYSFGIRAFISYLIISLLLRSDIVIVKHLLGFKDVGVYSIAAHIVDLLQVASNMVGSLLLTKLSDTEDDVSRWILMKKMLMVFFVFLCLGNLGFLLFGRFLLGTFYGADFVPSFYVYLWLIPASYGLSFGSLFNNYLNSKGFPLVSIILPAIALALNIGLNFLLIPRLGIIGAAISTSIAYVLWFVLIIAYEQRDTQGRMFKHLVPVRQDWRELWQLGRNTLNQVGNRLFKRHAG